MTRQPLRVLVAGISWPPETFLARLFRGLLAAGIELTVACGREPGPEWLSLPGFVWLRTTNNDDSLPQRALRAGLQYGRALVVGNSDLQRFKAMTAGSSYHGRSPVPSWLLAYPGRRWDVIYFPWNAGAIAHLPLFDIAPVVVSCRGAQVNVAPHNPERSEIRDGLRETFARATAVHCVSDAILAEAMRYGLDPARATIIRPAVDPDVFRPAAEPTAGDPSGFRVVTTGSFIWRKGYEYLLAAAALLRERGVPIRLSLIGDGPERQRLVYTLLDLGLQDSVELPGKLPPAGVLARLQTADAFVLSSLSEGISNAVLEGMACGLPVVTTTCGGMAEAVDDGVEGYLVPTRDPAAMADALATLWADPATRQRMGAAARARIERDFRLEDQISRFIALLQQAAQPRPEVAR